MFDYIFQFVDSVDLHVGAMNIRSQIAVSRLGAKKKNKLLFGSPISRKESWARGKMIRTIIDVDVICPVTY